MQSLFSQFEKDLDNHFYQFLVYVSKRYRVKLENLKKDFDEYQHGKLEMFDPEPIHTANSIKQLTGSPRNRSYLSIIPPPLYSFSGSESSESSESSEAPSVSDTLSEIKTKVNPILDSSEESISLGPGLGPANSLPAALALDNSDATVSLESEESEPLPKASASSKAGREPKGKAAGKASESSGSKAGPEPKGKAPGSKVKVKSIDDLVDKPKTPTEVDVPKGTQFLKGTNLVVVKQKVVAAVTKKGFVVLGKRYLTSFDKPEYQDIKYEVWDKKKIEKKFSK